MTDREPKRGPGRPKSETGPKPARVMLKASEAWKAWLDGFAKERGVDVSGVIEEALKWYACHMRHDPPPDR